MPSTSSPSSPSSSSPSLSWSNNYSRPIATFASIYSLAWGGKASAAHVSLHIWIWWCKVIYDHIWWCMVIYDHIWSKIMMMCAIQCMVVYDHIWSKIMMWLKGLSCTCESSYLMMKYDDVSGCMISHIMMLDTFFPTLPPCS